jgi:RNA helicase HrpA
MHYLDLPVYKHKELILEALKIHQVIVVESPTGSGKTTQLPIILHEAGFTEYSMIGVTQPRRIAAVSVSEFIANQMNAQIPGVVGYKMRFEDKTDLSTKIKIMTDGILLQEMKLDPYLSKYNLIVVDEAHERSLTIDFILGLLKRILEARSEFKVIISSATINTQVFSEYFDECPVVKIDAETFPVTLIYDPPIIPAYQEGTSSGELAQDARLYKIHSIINRCISEKRKGDILIFLSGEKMIKDCMKMLMMSPEGKNIHIVPLYGRLGKDEQDRVFDEAPRGKIKVVISTNIAETSITIDGITTVIDSGLVKLNHYNPKTFTSSLIEGPISKASANQRKGRAGRTQAGSCYRLYSRKDFENRPLFTTEEIYRTDLSEAVLRMADLGITDFEDFDFVSPPKRDGLLAAIETLKLLNALNNDQSLSNIGKLMTEFPLPPRQSRIIVEAMLQYPYVTQETIIAAAFLSTQSPYLLPPGEEMDARRAHHHFRDNNGDFVSYLKLYQAFKESRSISQFCEKNYLDEKTMKEISNVVDQLELIVSGTGFPILSGGSVKEYLSCIAKGMIQFVCVKEGRNMYRTLTADRIFIHPGSVMFKMDPQCIVAGEIVKTTRMYAMSVSPLSIEMLENLAPGMLNMFLRKPSAGETRETEERYFANSIKIAGHLFEIVFFKKKKMVMLPWEKLREIKEDIPREAIRMIKSMRGCITVNNTYRLLEGEKLKLIFFLAKDLDIDNALSRTRPQNISFNSKGDLSVLMELLPTLLHPAVCKEFKRELLFVYLSTDNQHNYRFICSKGFHKALNESLASLDTLIYELGEEIDLEIRELINSTYRRLTSYLN